MAKTKERKDTWTKENDEFLANTVLDHLMNGSTQTKAFKEAGEKLKRTAAACGYRWNATLRKQYEKELKEAKRKKVSNSKFNSPASKKEDKGAIKGKGANAKKATVSNPNETPSLMSVQTSNESGTQSSENDKTSEVKIKHILSTLQSLDQELSLDEISKVTNELKELREENKQLKEEIKSVYLILDRVRRSVEIDIHSDKTDVSKAN
ncbi:MULTISPECIES: hypothetical protein [Bacillaceae]|uniref:Myb-like domain-containing protein n=1 Tax=Evansella alkalicola TaxID=745819 RepID=A0ABS6JS98_9BACI|nr:MULTISPECIES: hypothetical protein [Bacillaceae]MBU9720584.1 hypothetical protein [Bacillus alkalicola]